MSPTRTHSVYCDLISMRCDERLQVNAEGSTLLGYTGLHGGLEHLTETETRLINERFVSVMGECDLEAKSHTHYDRCPINIQWNP